MKLRNTKHYAGLAPLVRDTSLAVLGISKPDDKGVYFRGLKTLEEHLTVLESHLASRTWLVSN